MNLSPIDLVIIGVYFAVCIVIGIVVKRYVRHIADFAVAGRSIGVNMGLAGMTCTGTGMVAMMYTAELGFRYGFAGSIPGIIGGLASFVVGTSGFLIGPLRKAGVMTVPELLERRFGKGVRWLAGLVVATGGLLNMGIFLRLAGEFLIHATGLSPAYLEWTMVLLLSIAILYTMIGGMVAVVVTNYLQFIVIGISVLTISGMVIWQTPWTSLTHQVQAAYRSGIDYRQKERIAAKDARDRIAVVEKKDGAEAANDLRKDLLQQNGKALRQNAQQLASQYVLVDTAGKKPEALTMGNPLNPAAQEGVGLDWLIWQMALSFSAAVTWQTGVSRGALSAKDVATSKRIYQLNTFHPISAFLLPALWAMGAYIFFCSMGGLPEGIGARTATPEFLARLLPTGIIGVVIAGLLAAQMSTDSSYILTWATVIYNDLIMPCFSRPVSEKARLLTIRALVVLIGIFLIIYGLVYELPCSAFDYISVTGTICVASMFALLIGSVYFPWTNRTGAVAAIILGATGPISFVVVNALATDPSRRISPATAGLSAYALAFGGLIGGSLLSRFLFPPKTTAENVTKADGGQS